MGVKCKWFCLILGLSLLVTLAGCGQGTDTGSTENINGASGESNVITIGAALPDFDDKWLSYLQDGIRSYEEEHDDVEVIYVDAMNNAETQLSQVETFITQGVDAILLVPVDTVSAPNIVRMANDAGIPLIVVNRHFNGVEEATAFVASDSKESGLMQMEEVAKLLNGEGNIAIINGMLGHEAQIKRTEGNLEVISQYPNMQVVREGNADWDRAKGMTLMENWLQSGVQIDAVVANNDEMAIGAIMAIEAAGKLDEIIVAGIDATPDALEFVQQGKLSVTVFQDAIGQGRKGLETAVKAAKGEEFEKEVMIPYELVTIDNVEEYIAKWE